MRETIALIALCGLIALVSLGVLGWALVAGEGLTLDTLLLAAICLTIATVFGFCALWFANDAGLLEKLKTLRRAPGNPAPTEKKG